jgi:hypothetical protein
MACLAQAQSYTIDWFTVDGGGGTSTGGVYAVSGTLGQPDAGAMAGGTFALTGGFWSMADAVQTPGAPLLSINYSNGTVRMFWPLPAPDWQLEAALFLPCRTNDWTRMPPPYPTNATHCVVSEPAPTGNKFYRLCKP